MNNDDKQKTPIASEESEPSGAFTAALTALQRERSGLARAIDSHDFESVRHVASDVASLWLVASKAYERITARLGKGSPLANSARSALREQLVAIQQLFTRAQQEIAVPTLTRALDRLWFTLAAASNESAARNANNGNR
jgi:hypothetical protein